jgi:hypothetical protein
VHHAHIRAGMLLKGMLPYHAAARTFTTMHGLVHRPRASFVRGTLPHPHPEGFLTPHVYTVLCLVACVLVYRT